ncbi:hypothetical protein HDV06_003657 [Boothiomyces sp. JEL0866]|nr:hypothetical protein HDV06_003657 [Boothiomyces sp. JEL0866]
MESLEQYKSKYLMVLEEQLALHRQLKNQELEIAHLRHLVYQKDIQLAQFLPSTKAVTQTSEALVTKEIRFHTKEASDVNRYPTPTKDGSESDTDSNGSRRSSNSDQYRQRTHRSSPAFSKQKYDTLANGKTVPRQCGDCFANYTSGHWCIDVFVKNGHICQKCYRRRKKVLDSGQVFRPTHECNHCKSRESPAWYKHPSQGGLYHCKSCNNQLQITCDIITLNAPRSPISTGSRDSNFQGSKISDLVC